MGPTKIEWTDRSWNPVRGCSMVSAGCTNCYAMKQAHRFSGKGQPYEGLTEMGPHGPCWNGKVRLVPDLLDAPLRWKKPQRIFVNSMSDMFHEDVPDEFIDQVFAVMALAQQHSFQVLTKRPGRMQSYCSTVTFERLRHWMNLAADGGEHRVGAYNLVSIAAKAKKGTEYQFKRTPRPPLPNVWLGVSVEDQKTADERIPLLLQTPAAIRFVSYEPALGPVDFSAFLPVMTIGGVEMELWLSWIIAGGESGPNARPAHPDWFRSVRDQCQSAGIPFFFKQWGEWLPAGEDGAPCDHQHLNCSDQPVRVGKKRAGRLLDGREWNELPEVHRG